MHLVVGLGNPGERYEDTRHNVGWWVLDELAGRWRAERGASSPLFRTRRARFAGGLVDLVQPLTFMNRSGEAVSQLMIGSDELPEKLLVVTDDVYLPLGTIRLRSRGSSGGHRGLESIEGALGHQEFDRLRIGIGAAESSAELKEHVLERFAPGEREQVDAAVRAAADAVECWVADGIVAAMNRFNRRTGKEEVQEP